MRLKWVGYLTGYGRHGGNDGNEMDTPIAHLIGVLCAIGVETHDETDCKAHSRLEQMRNETKKRSIKHARVRKKRGYAQRTRQDETRRTSGAMQHGFCKGEPRVLYLSISLRYIVDSGHVVRAVAGG